MLDNSIAELEDVANGVVPLVGKVTHLEQRFCSTGSVHRDTEKTKDLYKVRGNTDKNTLNTIETEGLGLLDKVHVQPCTCAWWRLEKIVL